MPDHWGWNPSSVEAIGAAAAAVFTLAAVVVASLAAIFSYRLNEQQTRVSRDLVDIEKARAAREEEQAERDRVAHEAEMAERRHRSTPFLRLQQDRAPSGGSNGDDHWDANFVVHNEGGAPAISAVVTVEDDNGWTLGESAPRRIDPAAATTLSLTLPRHAIASASSGDLRSGLTVRVLDGETGAQDSYSV